ncbi:energy transducer TonB [bacterium]|nr:energy transducer TonB [bacterium]
MILPEPIDVKSDETIRPGIVRAFHHLREKYYETMEIGLLSSITLMVILFNLIPKPTPPEINLTQAPIILEVTDVPQTLQPISVKGAPIKPVIPIAADIPEELMVDETDLIFGTEDGLLEIPAPPVPPGGGNKTELFPPKLMVSKFPEYPKELQKQGVSGVIVLLVEVDVTGKVINHKVKSNSTNNAILEKLSIETVYKCRYNPASDGKKPIVSWTEHRFEFNEKVSQ